MATRKKTTTDRSFTKNERTEGSEGVTSEQEKPKKPTLVVLKKSSCVVSVPPESVDSWKKNGFAEVSESAK